MQTNSKHQLCDLKKNLIHNFNFCAYMGIGRKKEDNIKKKKIALSDINSTPIFFLFSFLIKIF